MDEFKQIIIDGHEVKVIKAYGFDYDKEECCYSFPREPFFHEKVIIKDGEVDFAYLVDKDYILWVTQRFVDDFYMWRPCLSLCIRLVYDKDPDFDYFELKYGKEWVEKNSKREGGDQHA